MVMVVVMMVTFVMFRLPVGSSRLVLLWWAFPVTLLITGLHVLYPVFCALKNISLMMVVMLVMLVMLIVIMGMF